MRSLNHPNILKLERVYEEDENVYLVLECIEGGDLFNRVVSSEKFNERYCAIIARKLLVALAYMHERNIIHRDLKLENIMLTSVDEEADVKIVDFGFASEMTPKNLQVFCGSPGYVAPEILHKQPYTSKVDVYGVGIVLFIILSGNSPFFARTAEETLARNREGRIKFDATYWAEISDDARDFVRMLTEFEPEARPNAIEALKHRWIQQHNRQYFESQEMSIKRPSFSKRRTFDVVSTLKSPQSLKRSTLPSISQEGRSPQSAQASLAAYARAGLTDLDKLAPPMRRRHETSLSKASSPTNSNPSSPYTASSIGSQSVDSAGNKRTISWKSVKPPN